MQINASLVHVQLFQYGDEHNALKLDFKRTQHMESALMDLEEFMSSTISEIERKNKQKLLRNLKVS
jgi:hypothetical protein